MLLLSSISNKDVLFIFSANKVAAEEVPLWVPLEETVVKDVHWINSSTYLHNWHSNWVKLDYSQQWEEYYLRLRLSIAQVDTRLNTDQAIPWTEDLWRRGTCQILPFQKSNKKLWNSVYWAQSVFEIDCSHVVLNWYRSGRFDQSPVGQISTVTYFLSLSSSDLLSKWITLNGA